MKTNETAKDRASVAKASMRHARVAPRKARMVVDQVKGLKVTHALATLENTRRSANPIVEKIIRSAVANAVEKDSTLNPDDLFVIEGRVDKGRTLKRIRPRAMGRATQILKHSSHITVSVG